MQLCEDQMRELAALEQTLYKASAQLRAILSSRPTSTPLLQLSRRLGALNGRQPADGPRTVPGYVYCIRDEASGHHKIGQTIKAPLYRLGSLQSGTPNQLTLCFAIKVADIDAAESAIHAELEADHLRGEWYRSEESKIAQCFWRVGAEHWSDINGQPCQGYQFGYESMQFDNMRKESLGTKERVEFTTGRNEAIVYRDCSI
jgi:hypothetical protein